MMDASVIDEATAVTALHRVREHLATAVDNMTVATDDLSDLIVATRPKGLLTVDEMATAVGRDRNYIDSIWSLRGGGQWAPRANGSKKQTRIPVTGDAAAAREAYDTLAAAADRLRKASVRVSDMRAERNRTVALIYGAKFLRPGVIAGYVGVDRNHVGRIARAQGVAPVHRPDTRNQYSAAAEATEEVVAA